MIKLTFCVRRLPHLSRQEFQRYWWDTHGPLVKRHAGALRIRRYVQVHALETPLNDALRASRAAAEGFDGIAELWWDSLDDFTAATSTPEGRAASLELLDDERKFIDHAQSPLWIGEERPVVE